MNVSEPFFVRVHTKETNCGWYVSKVFAINNDDEFLVYNPGGKIEVADEFGAPASEPLILEPRFEWIDIKEATLVEKNGRYWRDVDYIWPDTFSSSR